MLHIRILYIIHLYNTYICIHLFTIYTAEKPREAIEMYMHIEDWSAALRVAENYDPPSVPDIHVQQGKLLVENKQFKVRQSIYIY